MCITIASTTERPVRELQDESTESPLRGWETGGGFESQLATPPPDTLPPDAVTHLQVSLHLIRAATQVYNYTQK